MPADPLAPGVTPIEKPLYLSVIDQAVMRQLRADNCEMSAVVLGWILIAVFCGGFQG